MAAIALYLPCRVNDRMQYYREKTSRYFTQPRNDLISCLPARNGLRVLEVGVGRCDTLVELKTSGKACEVAGIELFELPDTFQQHPAVDRLILGNIETTELDFSNEYFDAILFGDVLEHLVDPWEVVKKMAPLLAKNGLFIASIPNIRSRQALKSIFFKGRFAYAPEGLFDKTHLRWFCKQDMVELLTPPGFCCVSSISNLDFKTGSTTRLLNRWTGRILEEFLTVQFITVSQRIG